jgi:hypothetical protein
VVLQKAEHEKHEAEKEAAVARVEAQMKELRARLEEMRQKDQVQALSNPSLIPVRFHLYVFP